MICGRPIRSHPQLRKRIPDSTSSTRLKHVANRSRLHRLMKMSLTWMQGTWVKSSPKETRTHSSCSTDIDLMLSVSVIWNSARERLKWTDAQSSCMRSLWSRPMPPLQPHANKIATLVYDKWTMTCVEYKDSLRLRSVNLMLFLTRVGVALNWRTRWRTSNSHPSSDELTY